MTGQEKRGLTLRKYTVASNDINRPSLVMLMSLVLPLLFACSLGVYLLSMPLDTGGGVTVRPSVVVISRSTGEAVGTAVVGGTPVVGGTLLRIDGRDEGASIYVIYLPFVVGGRS